MASNNKTPITFAVPGAAGTLAAATRGATGQPVAATPFAVKTSVRVAAQRDGGAPVRATAVPGEDIVAVHIEGGPVLYLHPETARDLMLGAASAASAASIASSAPATSAAARGTAAANADVPVSVQLQWPGQGAQAGQGSTRDLADIGRVVVSGFQVLTGLLKNPVVDWAAGAVVNKVDSQVDAGVYQLRADKLEKLKGSTSKLVAVPAATEPMLVLMHGTFVETVSTFDKLWKGHASGVESLFTHYGNRVYALDHPTLGASPVANARTLVDALPNDARLHLVTHSRGGLVAEVLARVAGVRGELTAVELACFAGAEYAAQKQELLDLAQAVRLKNVQVERVVRVACPARGTLLASKRLDAYLSVLKWTLEAAGIPVAPTFVEFIGAVAQRRADPAEIPGIAAMIPGTPLVNWLNAAPHDIPGDLRVVAGDLQHGSTITSWLKSLLADAYYWTDNDIVVQTRSMYGGTPRTGGATFLLDQGSGVTHFDYFKNDKTANAVLSALVQAQPPLGFRPIGPLSWKGEDSSGARDASAAAREASAAARGRDRGLFSEAQASTPDASKPAVFVLPGILGSNLKQGTPPDDERIWLSPRLLGGFKRLAYQPGDADAVKDDGPIGMVYSDLVRFLDATHEVIPFGYDWRRPLKEEALRLAQRVKQALDERATTRQPVRLLAHSMGGLLARTMQLVAPEVWQQLMAHADARFVMLGTPNGGSWAPMQVLSGDDTFGNALASIGSPFANHQARSLMAQMPGFMQLQAGLLDDKLGLAKAATWKQLADDDYQREQQKNWWHRYANEVMGAAYEWGVPTQGVLDQARALRQELDAQLAGVLKACAAQVLLVVGHAKTTPMGYDVGSDGFVYLEAQDTGDGRVPLESALLPGVRTWKLDCEHGSLPSAKQAFDAYLELLTRGTTQRLDLLNATRGGPASHAMPLRSRPSRRPATALPPGNVSELFSSNDGDGNRGIERGGGGTQPALQVVVLNGNLRFVQLPLMLGHYRAMELTGTEAVVDRHLGGAMSTALKAGLYPEPTGTQRVFFNLRKDEANPWQPPYPQAAIVVGLGEEGTLTATGLEHSVCQAVKAWSQRAREEAPQRAGGIELAATLMGSGGLGITPGAAARAIAQGVRQANRRLLGTGWPLVTRLTLVEWYLDRASDAWRGLQVLAISAPNAYQVAPTIAQGTGPLRRQPDSGYRGADYDLISTTTDSDGTISFALDTKRARTEVRAQRTQPKLMKMLVARAATAAASDPNLGRTLFQLLVPLELKPFLAGNDRLVLQLDDGTAPIPWELLDTTPGESGEETSASDEPWSIRTRLLRKLATTDFRATPRDADTQASVLIIGAPKTDDERYPPLPGARAEAQAVAAQFKGPGGIPADRVVALTNEPEFDAVIVELMARPYRVVHIAGHGAPVQRDNGNPPRVISRGGVVLSKDVFLGPDEIEKLPEVPELVFVNCCHLGGHDADRTLKGPPPVDFAAGVADSLIKIGVRCVVAAGWAVDDNAAAVFAQAFYRTLLAGRPFVEAVVAARKAARAAAPADKTWAAYQCYGDPNWVFTHEQARKADPSAPVRGEFDGIASAVGLALMLETLAVRARFEPAPDEAAAQAAAQAARIELRRKVQGYEDHYAELWGGMGAIAEAYGLAWEAAGETDKAIHWLGLALRANDASASMKTQERHGSLRAQRAWAAAQHAAKDTPALQAGREGLTGALRDLQALSALQPTTERLSLCGSAWQRLALLDARAGDRAKSLADLKMALEMYTQAEAATGPTGPTGPTGDEGIEAPLFQPGLQRLVIELVLHIEKAGLRLDTAAGQRLRRSLQACNERAPDFSCKAGLIGVDVCAAIQERSLARHLPALSDSYAELHRQLRSPAAWHPVAEQIGFVLRAYQAAATAEERKPARSLAEQLARYAV